LTFPSPKIAFLDLEGTLLKKDIALDDGRVAPSLWTVIAEQLGREALARENQTKDAWNLGKYASYIEWMKDTVLIHKDFYLSEKKFNDLIDSVEFQPGVDELFRYFDENKVITCIITGGFKELADRVISRFRVDHAISACEYIFDRKGHLDRAVYFPSDYFGKVDFMKIIMREYQATPYDCIFVGDGKNDVDLASNVAVSFAFNGQAELQRVVTESISQPDGQHNLNQIAQLLRHPTNRMALSLETNVPTKIVGEPKNVTQDRCIQLWKEAMWVRRHAHAPYSQNFRVGAALLAEDNQIFTGCNFENASFGATICAERSAVAKMISSGQRTIKALAVASDSAQAISPCGICRQVIAEFANKTHCDVLLCSATGDMICESIDTLLPHAFSLRQV
jgi:phosphoserine phosphatase